MMMWKLIVIISTLNVPIESFYVHQNDCTEAGITIQKQLKKTGDWDMGKLDVRYACYPSYR